MTEFNATPITNRLIVGGGIVSSDEVDWLRAQGVTHIISAAAELDDAAHYQRAGLAFLHISWQDDGAPKSASDFLTALRFAVDADAQRANDGPLPVFYVHCAAGHNRGPLMATFLLAALSGLPGDAAFELIRAMRPVVTAFLQPHYRTSCLAALEIVHPVRPQATVAPESATTIASTTTGEAAAVEAVESQVAQSLKSAEDTAADAAATSHSFSLADGGTGHVAGVDEPASEPVSAKRARN